MFLDNVAVAFLSVVTPYTLFLMAIGVLAGLIAGAIPGFTITMAVVLTLPFTFGMQPIEGLSTMIGVYVGALTGGLFACALIGIPGTPSAIATTFDAFPMARSGRAGLALGIGIWASFFAGIISAVLLAILAPSLAAVAEPCRHGLQDEIGYVLPRPALAHCSSWSPVTPLTPTAPVTLPSTMIGTPPGEAKTPGRVAVAGPPLLITSMKTRVGRR